MTEPLEDKVLEAAARIEAATYDPLQRDRFLARIRDRMSYSPTRANNIVQEAARQIDALREKGLLK